MNARLTLNGQSGAVGQVEVVDGGFVGTFEVDGELVAGRYFLEVVVERDRQRGSVRRNFPEGLQDDRGTKRFDLRVGEADRKWAEIAEELVEEMKTIRETYDRTYQIGQRILSDIETVSSQGEEERRRSLEPWRAQYQESAALSGARQTFLTRFGERYFVLPYEDAVGGISSLYQLLQRLRSSFAVRILDGVGEGGQVSGEDRDLGRWDPGQVVQAIFDLTWELKDQIPCDRSIWTPHIQIGAEAGQINDETYVSRVSGFQIEVPADETFQVLQGERNDPVRLHLLAGGDGGGFAMASILVQMVEFPWAEGREELAAAWEHLAESEWPGYRKGKLEWVEQPAEEGRPAQEYYLFEFYSMSEQFNGKVEVRLFFPGSSRKKHLVYGLMTVAYFPTFLNHNTEQVDQVRHSFRLLD